ncbi:MAG: hypothetical protein Tsb005_12020 [Gammaproteobacteria bacterium]
MIDGDIIKALLLVGVSRSFIKTRQLKNKLANIPNDSNDQNFKLNNQATFSKRYAVFLDRLVDGMNEVIYQYFPLIFSGFVLHDAYIYWKYPWLRYDTHFGDIITGLSINANNWADQMLGSSINETVLSLTITRSFYWGLGTLSLPIIVGIVRAVYASDWAQEQKNIRKVGLYSRLIDALTLRHKQLEKLILWDGEFNEDDITGLIKLWRSDFNRGLTRFFAMNLLYNVASRCNAQITRECAIGLLTAIRDNYKDENPYSRTFNLVKAKNINFISRIYASYLLWQLGYSGFISSLFFWLTVFPLKKYFTYRFLLSVTQSFYWFFQQAKKQQACLDAGKIWQLMSQSGQYECSACGNWTEVDYNHMFSGENCLSALLQTPVNAARLRAAIQQIYNITQIANIDLSQQNWLTWNDDDFAEIMSSLAAIADKQFNIFNITLPFITPQNITSAKAQAIGDFLTKIPVEKFSAANVKLDASTISLIFSDANNTYLSVLDLVNTQLDENGLVTLANATGLSANLRKLTVDNNLLTDSALYFLQYLLPSDSPVNLSVSNNLLSVAAFNYIPENVQMINFSINNLFGCNTTAISNFVENGKLNLLNLANTQLNDEQLVTITKALINSEVIYLDVSLNQALSYYALLQLVDVWANTRLKSLIFSSTQLQDTGIIYLAQGLKNNTSLHTLYLDNTGMGQAGMLALCDNWPANLKHLSIADNCLTTFAIEKCTYNFAQLEYLNLANDLCIDNQALAMLGHALSNSSHINILDISNLGSVDAEGIVAFLRALSGNDQLNTFVASGTALGNQGFKMAMEILSSTNIKKYIFNNIFLDNPSLAINDFITSQGFNKLEYFEFENNNVDSNGIILLAQHLLCDIPNVDMLRDAFLSNDQAKALYNLQVCSTLKGVNFANNNISNAGAYALCHVQPFTDISISNINLINNPITNVDSYSCYISSASMTSNIPLGLILSYRLIQYTVVNLTKIYQATLRTNEVVQGTLCGLALLILLLKSKDTAYLSESNPSISAKMLVNCCFIAFGLSCLLDKPWLTILLLPLLVQSSKAVNSLSPKHNQINACPVVDMNNHSQNLRESKQQAIATSVSFNNKARIKNALINFCFWKKEHENKVNLIDVTPSFFNAHIPQ